MDDFYLRFFGISPRIPVAYDMPKTEGFRMLHPLADNLIIEPIDTPLSTKLIIPDRAKPLPTRGRVIARGPCRTLDSGVTIPMVVNVGDEVVFHKHGAEPIWNDEGRDLLIAREADVLAVVVREAA